MRLSLGVQYTGTKFHGWQTQKDNDTLQSTIEAALSSVANEPIRVICAGRTDAGVHATHQVIHFDTNANRSAAAWIFGTNSHLPHAISIQWAKEVNQDFHARFSALSRRYQYFIHNHSVRPGVFYDYTTWVSESLDETRMHKAAQFLLGEHDFSAYRSTACQSKTAKRYVFKIQVSRYQNLVIIDITANSFLHHMVRNIVGVLLEIGQGKKAIPWCQEVLEAKDRKLASVTALAKGLFLTGVKYADIHAIPTEFNPPKFFT